MLLTGGSGAIQHKDGENRVEMRYVRNAAVATSAAVAVAARRRLIAIVQRRVENGKGCRRGRYWPILATMFEFAKNLFFLFSFGME